MKKNEYIIELTKLMINSHDEAYTMAVIEAIRLAHQIDDTVSVPVADKLEVAMRTYLTKFGELQSAVVDNIRYLLANKQNLNAIKVYKDGCGLGLKECKEEIDLVRRFGLTDF